MTNLDFIVLKAWDVNKKIHKACLWSMFSLKTEKGQCYFHNFQKGDLCDLLYHSFLLFFSVFPYAFHN
jgi:hypothetical protein